MTSGLTAFMMAVGGTSLICYLLMNRVQNRSARREMAGSETCSTGSSYSYSSSGEGGTLLSWFAGESSSSDSSGASSDSGGGDGGGGGGGGD